MAHYDCIIVGGGPAGLTAGIYTCRAGFRALLIERMFAGGQITTTTRLENYPGFPGGVDGPQFGSLVHDQATEAGLAIEYDEVSALTLKGDEKRVQTASGAEHTANAVICAMGARRRPLGLEREDAFRGAGLSYCATCDGAFFRDRTVAVVGGGDTACEDALYLARIAKAVHLIHRRDTLRARGVMAERVKRDPRIKIRWDTVVEELRGGERLESLILRNLKTGQQEKLPVDGVFLAIGLEPQTELVRGQLVLDALGYIETDRRMRTGIAGVFAAGDVRNTPLRQVVTAAADGALAANSAIEYLEERSAHGV
jgi:thioredoxin reductase (NADPH)